MEKLLKIYVGCGLVFGGGYYMYRYSFSESKTERQPYFKESIKLLKGYKPAIDTLGTDIKVQKFNEDDSFNEITDKNAKLKIIVTGKTKRLADLFVYASRKETDNDWNIDALELQYRGSINKYKIFDRSLIFAKQAQIENSSSIKK